MSGLLLLSLSLATKHASRAADSDDPGRKLCRIAGLAGSVLGLVMGMVAMSDETAFVHSLLLLVLAPLLLVAVPELGEPKD